MKIQIQKGSNFAFKARLKQTLFLLTILLSVYKGYSQSADKKWGLGLMGGINIYSGDLGDNIGDFNYEVFSQTPTAAITISRYLNRSFDVTLMGTFGSYGYFKNGTAVFKGEMLHGNINIKYKLNNGYLIPEKSLLAPYLFAGAGVSSFSGTTITNGLDYPIVGGAGLNLRVTDVVGINYQITAGYMSTAHNNPNVLAPTDPTGNDIFLMQMLGVSFNLGKEKDTDKDGVLDKKDKCTNTPTGVKVDVNGCPIDEDKDGVSDYLDKCSNTQANVAVSADGCPIDQDADGIADYLDKCANTPLNVKVNADGCPFDSDNDGVADYMDSCLNSPANAQVNKNGCPLDADNDGVPDYLDKCPNTTLGGKVDASGCLVDADKDGVSDNLDKCPNTPQGGTVDATGCLLDTDKDGVADYQDSCSTVFGTLANHGCPAIKKEVTQLFEKALQGIQFETGKAVIIPVSFPILDAIVKVMQDNPTYKLQIGGHTDDVGDDAMNMTLSQNRAASVANYLITKGVSPLRVTATGYGESMPVDTNKSVKGRTRNRRVELKVAFMEIVK